MHKSKPEVFIIESLDSKNESNEMFEGKLLHQILNLHNKKCIYHYIHTKQELIKTIELFHQSNYRYLHFSCHGGQKHMVLNSNVIPFEELGKILRPKLKKKRLFISACNMVNDKLAKEIIPKSDCYSVIGPYDEIDFDSSAIFWASFYHLMFKNNKLSMEMKEIRDQLKQLTKLYNVPMNYFTKSRTLKQGYARKNIK